jgi:hypothetical protein
MTAWARVKLQLFKDFGAIQTKTPSANSRPSSSDNLTKFRQFSKYGRFCCFRTDEVKDLRRAGVSSEGDRGQVSRH